MIRTSANVKSRQVAAVIWNMASCSDLCCSGQSDPEVARNGTVSAWDSSGRLRVTVLRNPPHTGSRSWWECTSYSVLLVQPCWPELGSHSDSSSFYGRPQIG